VREFDTASCASSVKNWLPFQRAEDLALFAGGLRKAGLLERGANCRYGYWLFGRMPGAPPRAVLKPAEQKSKSGEQRRRQVLAMPARNFEAAYSPGRSLCPCRLSSQAFKRPVSHTTNSAIATTSTG
jgi:hypothetical protein